MPELVETPELRARAAAGDRDAFADLYRQHQPTVFRYLMRRTSGDRHLAEDLASEAWLRALRRLGEFDEQGRPLVAWLLTIAGHLVADHYKSGWKRLQMPRDDFTYGSDETQLRLMWMEEPADLTTVVADADFRWRARATLALALLDLTGWQRQVVRLRYLEGLSVRDTAAKLQVPEGSVKAAAYRAMRTLEEHPLVVPLWADLRDGGDSRG